MPSLGYLPVARSASLDLSSKIRCLGFILFSCLLLWLEPRAMRKATAPLNKAASSACCLLMRCRSAWMPPLAGQGGEERGGTAVLALPSCWHAGGLERSCFVLVHALSAG